MTVKMTIALALGLVGLVLPGVAFAAATPSNPNSTPTTSSTRSRTETDIRSTRPALQEGRWLLRCRVNDYPPPSSKEIKFYNVGNVAVPVGTKLQWRVGNAFHGEVTLPYAIPPGSSLIANVLPELMFNDAPCTVTKAMLPKPPSEPRPQ